MFPDMSAFGMQWQQTPQKDSFDLLATPSSCRNIWTAHLFWIGVPAHVERFQASSQSLLSLQVDGISSEPSHLVAGVSHLTPCASWDGNLNVPKHQLCEDLQGGCLNLRPDLTPNRFRVVAVQRCCIFYNPQIDKNKSGLFTIQEPPESWYVLTFNWRIFWSSIFYHPYDFSAQLLYCLCDGMVVEACALAKDGERFLCCRVKEEHEILLSLFPRIGLTVVFGRWILKHV